MAQPFEVAKTVLQVRLAADAVGGGQMRALGARTPRSAKGARHQDVGHDVGYGFGEVG